MEEWLILGYVARSHGVRGTLRIHWHDDIGQLLAFPKSLQLSRDDVASRIYVVKHHRPIADASLIDLAEVDSRDTAQALKGFQVAVPKASVPKAEAKEHYLFDLLHLEACDSDGASLGRVGALYDFGAAPLLALVDGPSGAQEQLVPITEATIRWVDRAANKVCLLIPEGLWDT